MEYRAVNREQLEAILGRQCGPMAGREGYVIGPDATGRLCHCSTHFTLAEAQKAANKLNGEKE